MKRTLKLMRPSVFVKAAQMADRTGQFYNPIWFVQSNKAYKRCQYYHYARLKADDTQFPIGDASVYTLLLLAYMLKDENKLIMRGLAK